MVSGHIAPSAFFWACDDGDHAFVACHYRMRLSVWLLSLLALVGARISSQSSTSTFVTLARASVKVTSRFLPLKLHQASPAERTHPRSSSITCTSMSTSGKYHVRPCRGGEDYERVIGSVDSWWGGRRMSPMLPRLFFENFCDTTFVVVVDPDFDDKKCQEERVVGFLCGFVSQSRVGEVRGGSVRRSLLFHFPGPFVPSDFVLGRVGRCREARQDSLEPG